MNLGLLVTPEAEEDLSSAYQWYEARRSGLGDDLLLCVEAVIESARRAPERFAPVDGEIRRALLRRFPYGVFYVVEPDRLVVLAVQHSAREPRSYLRRRAPPRPTPPREDDT